MRVEVPEVCRIYCARTWSEALNRVGVEASSELRNLESIFYPEAIRPSTHLPNQADVPPSIININEEVPPRSPLSHGQPKLAKVGLAPSGVSPNKTTTTSETEMASQGFQRELDSTVLPTGGTAKTKERIANSEADTSASQTPKIQLKLKK